MKTQEALLEALAALLETKRYDAAKRLVDMLLQRGCDVHEPGCDRLVKLIDVIIDG